jgi:hypothetical protein
MSHPGPKLVPLDLTGEERDALRGWTRRWKQSQDSVLRARIILNCAQGQSNEEVADELGVNRVTVGKWRKRFISERLYPERREAERLGIHALELERDIPLFSQDGTRMIFAPYRCVRYSLPRRERNGPTWMLVQRTKPLGANLPNDFLLTPSGPLKAGLEEQLRRAAEEYSRDYFEFEGTPGEVAVYWTEWGGPQKVRRLYYYLERLAAY